MNLKQTIRKILIEEMEFSSEFRRRIEGFKNLIWNNFVTNYPCDYDDFTYFMIGIYNEIDGIIQEGYIDEEPFSDWLTIDEAKKYVNRYMIDDLKEFYVSRCKE